MLVVNRNIVIPRKELQFSTLRSQGAGGQNVNKVSTAVQLRFDIINSTLPPYIKQRLLDSKDRRISREGVILIKAQEHRSQKKNKEAALARLQETICGASKSRKRRVATRPTQVSVRKRLEGKARRGRIKTLRSKTIEYE